MSKKVQFGEGPSPDRLTRGLRALLQASQYAHDTNRPVSEFAIEIQRLEQLGLSSSELRWLICKNYLGHLVDVTRSDQAGRKSQIVKSLTFESRSCFVLTSCGVRFAHSLVACHHQPAPQAHETLPSWDGELRVLYIGTSVVREFHARACS